MTTVDTHWQHNNYTQTSIYRNVIYNKSAVVCVNHDMHKNVKY